MKTFNVTGMSCAACSARVEKAVSSLEDVLSCSVNLLTGTMNVEGGDDESIISAVVAAGYGAQRKGAPSKKEETNMVDKEIKAVVGYAESALGLYVEFVFCNPGKCREGKSNLVALDVVGVELVSVNVKFGVVVCHCLKTGLSTKVELYLVLLLCC